MLGFISLINFSVSARPLAVRPINAMTAAPARANEAANAYSTCEKRLTQVNRNIVDLPSVLDHDSRQ